MLISGTLVPLGVRAGRALRVQREGLAVSFSRGRIGRCRHSPQRRFVATELEGLRILERPPDDEVCRHLIPSTGLVP